MDKTYKRFSVGSSGYTFASDFLIDVVYNKLVFASLVGYNSILKQTVKELDKNNNNIYIEGEGYYKTSRSAFDFAKHREPNNDFGHVFATIKDEKIIINKDSFDVITYIFYRNEQEFINQVYNKIYKYVSTPILKTWMTYIIPQFRQQNLIYELDADHCRFNCCRLRINEKSIEEIISTGLKTKAISIKENAKTSSLMKEAIVGLDNYLECFGETLAKKIQNSFVPKFIPGEQELCERLNEFDDNCYYEANIDLFDAQRALIQANVNNLQKNNVSIVIGEMGAGKTLIGSGIAYSCMKKNGFNAIVLCPSHLTKKWKREVEKMVPNGEAYIVHSLTELLKLDSKIKDKQKKENLFIIISKESAKFGYDYRPCTIWSEAKKTFVCPVCGQPLKKKVIMKENRNYVTVLADFTKEDMMKQYAFNRVCNNERTVWNKEKHCYEVKECNAKLWTALNGEEEIEWVKVGSFGWILERHLDEMFDDLVSKSQLTRKETKFLEKLSEVIESRNNGELKNINRAPKKYPLSKYIKRFYKGYIDVFVGDEMHLYKGDSLQGQAFGDLVQSAKKKIGLTGTLLNGYADGLFYTLYRLLPGLMQKEGFEYADIAEFMRTFGVIKKTNKFSVNSLGVQDRKLTSSEKRLPGVSPLLFTKFLLENASFISLSDMEEGLPNYKEIPISVPMDTELYNSYGTLEENLKNCVGFHGAGGVKAMGSLLQTLSVYPDMPYDQPTVLHPDTGEVLVNVPSLEKGLRNKERELLRLIQEKKQKGEKVLVYYQWTNRTDIAEKIVNMLQENDIDAVVLESKIAPDKREEWINNQVKNNIDVLLCNPTLVETGLDLLDFTTIIFYQIGYNIFTMRQASRRSYRLSQKNDIEVYYMYYENTIQEQALSLMATKLQASMAIEGKFSEEGLRALSNNEDLLTQIASSVINGIKQSIDTNVFSNKNNQKRKERKPRERKRKIEPMKFDNIGLSDTHLIMHMLFSKKQHVANL